MDDLFMTPDPVESDLRTQLTNKWKEKYPTAPPEFIGDKVESDLYIKTLERQKDELRMEFMKSQEEIQKGKALEELIDRLNHKENIPAPPKAPENTPPELDVNRIEALIDSRYEQKKRTEAETENFNKVHSRLRDRFGERAGEYLQEQAQTLGLTKEEINTLAKKSPEAFFRTMGLQTQEKDLFMAPPRSNVRNDSFAPKTTVRDWNFYEAMKKSNPTEYWAPKTQLQMHRDADALGDRFGID